MRSPGRWSGQFDYLGRKHNPGTHDTPYDWGIARDNMKAELRKQREAEGPMPEGRTELDGMRIAEFVASAGNRDGWPWGYKGTRGQRAKISTFEHHQDQIKPFVEQFGRRHIKGGVSRREARMWADTATENQLTSAIAMYNDAATDDDTVMSPFRGLSRSRSKGRKGNGNLPDVLTRDEVDMLCECVYQVVVGDYARVIDAMIECEATMGVRNGELWGMERTNFRPNTYEVQLELAVGKGGRLDTPKTGPRWAGMGPSAVQKIMSAPALSDRWLLPAPQGGPMTSSNWANYWHPIRALFTSRLPADHWLPQRIARAQARAGAKPSDGQLDFYELKHRACTWMVTPQPHGLGMDPADVSYQCYGHYESADVIEKWYVRRRETETRDRIRSAFGVNVHQLRTNQLRAVNDD